MSCALWVLGFVVLYLDEFDVLRLGFVACLRVGLMFWDYGCFASWLVVFNDWL